VTVGALKIGQRERYAGAVDRSHTTSTRFEAISTYPKRAGGGLVLLFILGFFLVTGLLKALWLHHALTDDTLNPHFNDPSAARFYLWLGVAAPVVVAVSTLLVARSARTRAGKVLLVAKIGCVVTVLPWVVLMASGVAS